MIKKKKEEGTKKNIETFNFENGEELTKLYFKSDIISLTLLWKIYKSVI